MDIYLINNLHPLWNKTIDFASNCSWQAGPYLARMMQENRFLEWERVIIACKQDRIVGFCTFTKDDELPSKWGYYPFIGFVFVEEESRGNRISELMINKASEYAKSLGYNKIYLMSGEHGLYEKYGFKKIGDFETIFKTVDQLFCKDI